MISPVTPPSPPYMGLAAERASKRLRGTSPSLHHRQGERGGILAAKPFDDVVKIFLFVAVEKAEFAAGFAAAAHVHLRVDIAALDIESDRPGLAPHKFRAH